MATITPVSSRTITIYPQLLPHPDQQFRWRTKAPGSTLDHYLDLTLLREDSNNDTVASFTTVVGGSLTDLTITQEPVSGPVLAMQIGGGTAGNDYPIRITITTNGTASIDEIGPRTFVFDCYLYVQAVGVESDIP
jgi:hypothetical protein